MISTRLTRIKALLPCWHHWHLYFLAGSAKTTTRYRETKQGFCTRLTFNFCTHVQEKVVKEYLKECCKCQKRKWFDYWR